MHTNNASRKIVMALSALALMVIFVACGTSTSTDRQPFLGHIVSIPTIVPTTVSLVDNTTHCVIYHEVLAHEPGPTGVSYIASLQATCLPHVIFSSTNDTHTLSFTVHDGSSSESCSNVEKDDYHIAPILLNSTHLLCKDYQVVMIFYQPDRPTPTIVVLPNVGHYTIVSTIHERSFHSVIVSITNTTINGVYVNGQ